LRRWVRGCPGTTNARIQAGAAGTFRSACTSFATRRSDQVRRETGDLEITRLLARHENVQVTQDYLHTRVVEDLRDAIERMEARGV
jgi:hypothetical protein